MKTTILVHHHKDFDIDTLIQNLIDRGDVNITNVVEDSKIDKGSATIIRETIVRESFNLPLDKVPQENLIQHICGGAV